MSDGTKRRIKLKFGQSSKNGTPQMSRASSPSAPPVGTGTPGKPFPTPPLCLLYWNSRKADVSLKTIANDTTPQGPLPTAEDIRSKIPPQGIRVGDLIKLYKGQVVGEHRKAKFTKLMRENSKYDKETKLLKPL